MNFFCGMHNLHHADKVERAFISVNRLMKRRGERGLVDRRADFPVNEWILDSGAFTSLDAGRLHHEISLERYAGQIARWSKCGNMIAAVAQDYMCEDRIIDRDDRNGLHFEEQHDDFWAEGGDYEYLTDEEIEDMKSRGWDQWGSFDPWPQFENGEGTVYPKLDIETHIRWTVDRYIKLVAAVRSHGCDTYIMPVIQGFAPAQYIECIKAYEAEGLLPQGAYVGVGSVCKRNGDPAAVLEVLETIKAYRPDLRIHGFGLKVTALEVKEIRALLESSDSMAWSLAAKKQGRDQNCWKEAAAYEARVNALIELDKPAGDKKAEELREILEGARILKASQKVRWSVALSWAWEAWEKARTDEANALDPDYVEWREEHWERVENRVILSLFDHSGEWSKPYRDAGYTVISFDLKEHAGPGMYITYDIADLTAEFLTSLGFGAVYGVIAAPPCTHFTSSGAQYWPAKDASGETDEMVHLVLQVLRTVNLLAPKFWALENPVGRIAQLVPQLGKGWFWQPWEFGDAWTKRTGLWGDFSRDLERSPVKSKGSLCDRTGGKSEATKAARSVTPAGFANAFFLANQ